MARGVGDRVGERPRAVPAPQREVDDVGAVVDRPPDRVAHHRRIVVPVLVVEHPHRQDRRGRGDARMPRGGPPGDEPGHRRAVAHRVGLGQGLLVDRAGVGGERQPLEVGADVGVDVAAAGQDRAVEVGVIRVHPRVDDGDGDARPSRRIPRLLGVDCRQVPGGDGRCAGRGGEQYDCQQR